jgi:hypothetical protein
LVLWLLLRLRLVFGRFLRIRAIRALGVRTFDVRTFGGTLALLGFLSGSALLLHIPLLLHVAITFLLLPLRLLLLRLLLPLL